MYCLPYLSGACRKSCLVLCLCQWTVASLLVGLVVLAVALRLVSRFGIGAGRSRMPVFDVEPTRVAVVPVRKVFGRVGIWGSSSWGVLIIIEVCGWWDVATVLVVVLYLWWGLDVAIIIAVATSASLCVSVSLPGVPLISLSPVIRGVVVWLLSLRRNIGRYVWLLVRLLCHLCLVLMGHLERLGHRWDLLCL